MEREKSHCGEMAGLSLFSSAEFKSNMCYVYCFFVQCFLLNVCK
jgi:hypothetical protein